ncbi:MAG TPA: DinB family protein [Bryobacteraceae bacterium]|nr:DinB family protein [Bryobacteraceae bacterium]
MPGLSEVLRIQIDYTAWASARLVAAAAGLAPEELTRDFGTADKSVLGTLVHVFGSDRVWLARLQGRSGGPYLAEADYHLAVLQNDWPALYREWRNWAAGLTDEEAAKVLSYTDMRGNHWKQPLWELVLHVVNHGTHHRGQVSGFLRTMGHVPPAIDMTIYHRSLH